MTRIVEKQELLLFTHSRFRIDVSTALILLSWIVVLLFLSTHWSMLRIVLATMVTFFGPGFALVSFLFRNSSRVGTLERMMLSFSLSMTTNSAIGFLLTRSPWGLRLTPFLIILCLVSIGCFTFAHRQTGQIKVNRLSGAINYHALIKSLSRNKIVDSYIFYQENSIGYFWTYSKRFWTHQTHPNKIVTIGLLIFLLIGGLTLNRAVRTPKLDPPMTEFYLLGLNELMEDYPEVVQMGDSVHFTYGIINREHETVQYTVQVLLNNDIVLTRKLDPIGSSETQLSSIEMLFPPGLPELNKVQFILYRDDQFLRVLYLWIQVNQKVL